MESRRPLYHSSDFGDQPFWGKMVAAAGAGPMPIPQKELSTESLFQAIKFCLSNGAAVAAAGIAEKMASEAGVTEAVRSFHRNLPIQKMACDLIPHLAATFQLNKGKPKTKLSSLAAGMIMANQPRGAKSLKLYESNPIIIEHRRWDPVTGGPLLSSIPPSISQILLPECLPSRSLNTAMIATGVCMKNLTRSLRRPVAIGTKRATTPKRNPTTQVSKRPTQTQPLSAKASLRAI